MDEYAGLTRKELERIAELGGLSFEFVDEGSSMDFSGPPEDEGLDAIDGVTGLLRAMSAAAFSDEADGFAAFAHENRARIRKAVREEGGDKVAELLVLGYRVGISRGSAACMNDLGALYYLGDIVEQDYARAKDLYEMAASRGALQSVINLGYIYEYGRCGEPDYAKAYECYAIAAALAPSSEAAYKLGDMYSRGRPVQRDLGRARALWERSLGLAEGYVEQAQPAVRIAKLLVDQSSAEYGVEPDPLRALALFQLAEIGLRLDIADGQVYYAKRLQEAIDGQARAREILERESDFSE